MSLEPADTLVERLRKGVLYGDARLHNPRGHDPLRMEAADRIAALEAEVARKDEALREMLHAVCHETGFAAAVRADSGKAYPWAPLEQAETIARAALEARND